MKEKYRIEQDSLGSLEVPKEVYYGIQTVRALNNFKITNRTIHPQLIRSLGIVKKAALLANHQLGYIDDKRKDFMVEATNEVIEHKLDNQFPTDPIQGGAGTSINMNVNEVIANRAGELAGYELGRYEYIHPNDHVNFAQSTNDVIPTAGKLTALVLADKLMVEIKALTESLLDKSEAFKGIVKVGRTHLQDAIPIQLSQEFHAYYSALSRDLIRIQKAFEDLREINMGATAVGTGLNSDPRYKDLVVGYINELSGYKFQSASDLVDSTRHVDGLVWAHSALKTFSVNLSKLANDVRLMASGPLTGLNEISIPEKQPGSSIMPGKVNPVIFEVTNQVCFQVFGNDTTIIKAAEAGQLELNVMEPVILYNLFESLEILTNVVSTLNHNGIKGIQANTEVMAEMFDRSLSLATVLAPTLGYKVASNLAKRAIKENKKFKDLILEEKLLTTEQLEALFDIEKITNPGIFKLEIKE